MGDTENLQGTDALKKIKELAEKANICMFTTNLSRTPLSARPMSVTHIDQDGIWFFSQKTSEQNAHISKNNAVQLFFSNTGSSEFLSIFGHAEIVTDKAMIEKLWTPIVKTWFTEGKDDPKITLLKVQPQEGYYWDTKNNKVVQMAKIAVGAIIGKTMDDGVQGKISV